VDFVPRVSLSYIESRTRDTRDRAALLTPRILATFHIHRLAQANYSTLEASIITRTIQTRGRQADLKIARKVRGKMTGKGTILLVYSYILIVCSDFLLRLDLSVWTVSNPFLTVLSLFVKSPCRFSFRIPFSPHYIRILFIKSQHLKAEILQTVGENFDSSVIVL